MAVCILVYQLGTPLRCKPQNHFHFLQSLQLRRSKFSQYAAMDHFD